MNLSKYISKRNIVRMVAVLTLAVNTSCTKEPLNEYDDDGHTYETYECDHTNGDSCSRGNCNHTATEGEDGTIDPDKDPDDE